ncbi:MAG: helicase-related protein [Candidatus Hermodarchaeota archaeon]
MTKIAILPSLIESGLEARNYQTELVEEIIDKFPDNYIVNLFWGSGKTIIALLLIAELRHRKLIKDRDLVLYTSGGAGTAERCKQAIEMAKKFGFQKHIGYLMDPKGKGLSLKMKNKLYAAANAIFSPVSVFTNDVLSGRAPPDTLKRLKLVIIDEVADIAAREMAGLRIHKHYNELLKQIIPKKNIQIVGLTATRDLKRLDFITKALNSKLMQRDDVKPFDYTRKILKIEDTRISIIDNLLTRLVADAVKSINDLLPGKLTTSEVLELLYGGILDRLHNRNQSIFIKNVEISDSKREYLLAGFSILHKLMHMRLLALESTPGGLYEYIQREAFEIEISSKEADISKDVVLFPLKTTPDNPETCELCSFSISKNSWAFEVYPKSGVDDITDGSHSSLPEIKGFWCQDCVSYMKPKETRNVINALESRQMSSGIRLTLKPEWRLIKNLAHERFDRTTLAGKTLHATILTKNKVAEGKQIVLICRYRALAGQIYQTLIANEIPNVGLVTGGVPIETRNQILQQFKKGELDVLVLTPVGGKGLDLYEAGVVIQLDVTINIDEMMQRRERIRGGEEYIIVYDKTSEVLKLERTISEPSEPPTE